MIDDTRNRVHPNAAPSGGTVKAGCAARRLSRLATVAFLWLAALQQFPAYYDVPPIEQRPRWWAAVQAQCV